MENLVKVNEIRNLFFLDVNSKLKLDISIYIYIYIYSVEKHQLKNQISKEVQWNTLQLI